MGPHHNVSIVTSRGTPFVNVFKASAENIIEAVVNGICLVEHNCVAKSHRLLDGFNVLDLLQFSVSREITAHVYACLLSLQHIARQQHLCQRAVFTGINEHLVPYVLGGTPTTRARL